MNETKPTSHLHENPPTRLEFWGTISMGAILLLICVYFFGVLLQQPRSATTYAALALFLLPTLSASSSLVLVLRHRQKSAFNVALYSMFGIGLIAVALFQGRALTASVSILVVASMVIGWLVPRPARRPYFLATAAAIGLMWVVEWINPPWRLPLAAVAAGPIAAIVFGIIFAILLFPRFRDSSLRTKLMIVFAVLTAIPIASLSFYANNQSRNQLYQASQDNLTSLAHQTANQVDTFIGNQLTNITLVAGAHDFAQYLSLDPSVRVPSDGLDSQQVLDSYAAQDKKFIRSYTLLDNHGKVVLDTAGKIGQDHSGDSFYQLALTYNKAVVTGPLFDPKTGAASLYFSAPVEAANGRILGVVYAEYDAGVIESQVEQLIPAGNPNQLLFRVVDDTNFVRIAHTGNLSLLYKPYKNLTAAQISDLQVQGMLPPGSPQSTLSAVENDTTLGLENLNQTQFFVTLSQTLHTNTLNTAVPLRTVPWLAFVRQSETTVLAPLDAQTRTLVLISLGLLALAFLAAFGFAQFVSTPVRRLSSVADQITGGDLNARAAITTKDEIGQLASSFNKMTQQLRDLIGSLEQRVADRTRNLELAAEVGRSVSQARALNEMLKDAVELIRSQFDLYYVQVYLTSPSQNALILQSGTGAVGQELVGRGHRLPIDAGSVNGRAAVEKHTVVITDTASSTSFRSNPLLPETRSEMAVPLMIGQEVVGVLDMQSQKAGALNEQALPAFEALAGQFAIAIQNSKLLAQTEQSRAEVEAQAKRLTRQGWEEYLDAIHQPEQTGFVFEQNQILPLSASEPSKLAEGEDGLSAPISIAGEAVGTLAVEVTDPGKNAQTAELLNSVARQVAQQLENLRLLESAERYRAEAEQAARSSTREGWKEYMGSNPKGSLAYVYDLTDVKPVGADNMVDEDQALSLPLKVRDETIGRVSILGMESADPESRELANTIVERLSLHIESLRQQGQTQSALEQSERLFEASSSLTKAADLQELVKAAVGTLQIPGINRAVLTTFNYDSADSLESLDIVANWWNGSGHEATPLGTHYPLEVIRVMPMFVSPTPVFFNDTLDDERVDAVTMDLVKRQNLRAVAALPLHVGSHQLGSLILEAEEPHKFSEEETRLFTALAPQIATVLENRRQFERAQKQAQRETMLNVISQKIQSATTVEAVLQIAARELGHALGAPLTIAQLGIKPGNGGHGAAGGNGNGNGH